MRDTMLLENGTGPRSFAALAALARAVAAAVAAALWTAFATLAAIPAAIRRRRDGDCDACRLGQYTLVEKLGEGGMGAVYLARHSMLRRPTAIKLLPPERLGAESAARFEREVQLTARLTHPNTVRVFDYGCTDEILYYAMEYLDGASLAEVVGASGPMPAARVIHILEQISGALVEAHGVGLIHRDIKPANIILTEQGGVADVPKLLDFGLVKQLDGDDDAIEPHLTRANSIPGTPLYMAPEAIQNPEQLDARADLYALAAVGYFLLTGQHVFVGRNALELCSHHIHSAPVAPSLRLGAAVPADLEALLLSCLEKDPARRPASARALQSALRACRDARTWTEDDARRCRLDRSIAAGSGSHVELALDVTAARTTGISLDRLAAGSSPRARRRSRPGGGRPAVELVAR
ncbi:MAG TPA: serine/threonine-protein kinase [Kofleriaceae bacterium]|nr:serine/threonine-protein kinase [Kofleriaceae bacterium]